jgi:hypothetical protein
MGLAIYPANQGEKASSQGGTNEGQVNAFSRSFVRRFEMSRKKVERSLEDLGGPLILAIEDVMKLTGYGQGKIGEQLRTKSWFRSKMAEVVGFTIVMSKRGLGNCGTKDWKVVSQKTWRFKQWQD